MRCFRPLFSPALLGFEAAALLGLCFGCGRAPDSTPAPLVSVETAPARVQPITEVVTAQGILFPIRQASLSPKITAPVRAFYVNRGSHVHRGQLLAVLENKDLAAGVLSAQGAYDQAQATYASTTSSALPEEIEAANLNLGDTLVNLKAQQQLYDSESSLFRQGAIARKQLDATEVGLTAAKSAHQSAEKRLHDLQASGAEQQQRAAKGQLEAAHGQYLNAAAQLGYTELRSPIDGVVAERSIYPGDIASAGTPLLVVMNTSKVVVRIHMPQPQAVQLKLGDSATIQVPGLKTDVPAKISVISPALDPNSTTVEVWIEADNTGRNLQPGTSVAVSIVIRTVPNALVIPGSAILTRTDPETHGEETYVMLVRGNSLAYSQAVTTGIQQGPLIQILSGIKAGAQVITGGAYGLPDGTKVKATKSDATSQD